MKMYIFISISIQVCTLWAVIELFLRDDMLMDKLIETVELIGRLH